MPRAREPTNVYPAPRSRPTNGASSEPDAVRSNARSSDALPIPWIVAAVLCGVLFTVDLADVESGITTAWDRALDFSLHATFGSSFFGFFEVMSALGAGELRIALITIIVVALMIVRFWWSAALTVVATGGAAALETLFKLVIGRPRPHLFPHVVTAEGSSFPSGHATNTCAFALVTLYVVWHVVQHRGVTAAATLLLIAVVLLVGLSRIVLGVHYPSDVLGGYALGVTWVGSAIAFFAPAVKAETTRAFPGRYDLLGS